MKKSLNFKRIFSVFVAVFYIKSCSLVLADCEHWEEFQQSYQQGRTSSLVDYIKTLYTLPSPTSEEELQKRSFALLYFLTTGGKYGFCEKPAIPSETIIIQQAFLFLGLAEATDRISFPGIDLTSLRRRYGFQQEDAKIQEHLMLGQRYFAYGRIIGSWCLHHDPCLVRMIFSQDYVLPRLLQEFKNGKGVDDLQNELKTLKNDFGKELYLNSLRLWENLFNISVKDRYCIYGDITEQDILNLRYVVSQVDTIIDDSLAYSVPLQSVNNLGYNMKTNYDVRAASYHPAKKAINDPFVMVLEDGSVIVRRGDSSFLSQSCHFRPSVEWSSLLYYSDNPNANPESSCSSEETEERLLEFLTQKFSLVSKSYFDQGEKYAERTQKSVWPEAFHIYGYKCLFPSRFARTYKQVF